MVDSDTSISKHLSFVLRHKPESIGLSLDAGGWANIDSLVELSNGQRVNFSRDQLLRIVAESDKQRFAISEDQTRIRASQGHSIQVDLGLEPKIPPPTLYHGTAARFLDEIMTSGLNRMGRQYVHLSGDEKMAHAVGMRHGSPRVLKINAQKMADEGATFFQSDNGVWLVERVEPKYFCGVTD